MKPILEVRNIAKKFMIGHQRLPYLSLREKLVNVFSSSPEKEEFWALRDISFNVMAGESIGIIGRNGAGKSTLLKILSRITPPTSGNIKVRGRIASLLEVGTGFHQELTGRENIFMNGSILGMKNAEIKEQFDEIVDFSGVEKFLDTPLKHFSSGMQLRLAFAVAAHLKPEVLIVDEVLAVGDAEFQKKCLQKMEDVSGQGRTVLFVSHNLPTLKAICKKGILIEKGKLAFEGDIDAAVHTYSSVHQSNRTILEGLRYYRSFEKVNSLRINGSESNSIVLNGRNIKLAVDVSFSRRTTFELQVHLKKDGVFLCSYSNFVKKEVLAVDAGRYTFDYEMEFPDVRSGKYTLDIYFTEPFVTWFANSLDDIEIEFINEGHNVFLNSTSFNWWGPVLMQGEMNHKRINE